MATQAGLEAVILVICDLYLVLLILAFIAALPAL
jgi:hypothetical protein